MEKRILAILLSFGNHELEFEDILLKTDSDGNMVDEVEINNYKVYEKLYLEMQEDEIVFSNKAFREIYDNIIYCFLNETDFDSDKIAENFKSSYSDEVSSIIMTEFKYELDKWEKRNVDVKMKETDIGLRLFQTLTDYRLHLITRLIYDIQHQNKDSEGNLSREDKTEIISYLQLKNKLAYRFGGSLNSRHYFYMNSSK